MNLKDLALTIYKAAIAAVTPEKCVRRWMKLTDCNLIVGDHVYNLSKVKKIYLVGAGKASAAMARAAETLLGDYISDGIVITKYGHGVPLSRCRLMEAGHPVPDESGVRATEALLDLVAAAGPEDLILCMISGGGSALCTAPAEGVSLEDKQETTRLLLGCGATIHEINTIRKHLSLIKGGWLYRSANGARIISLILSDVIGDDLDIIASGVTAPDTSTFGDCMEILSRYDLFETVPGAVRYHLSKGCKGEVAETPKPQDHIFANIYNQIVGSISDALVAAETEAGRHGFTPLILTSMIRGEAREVAKVLSAIAEEIRRSNKPVNAPACLLSGGETTVILKGDGVGGRNMELALSAGIELSGCLKTMLLCAGTDGTDGPTDAAGAFVDGTTVTRADALGISAIRHLANNDAYRFFESLGDLLITGPTRTNVMDIQIVLVDD